MGAISDDGKTISGAWEISLDDATWDRDVDPTYRMIRKPHGKRTRLR